MQKVDGVPPGICEEFWKAGKCGKKTADTSRPTISAIDINFNTAIVTVSASETLRATPSDDISNTTSMLIFTKMFFANTGSIVKKHSQFRWAENRVKFYGNAAFRGHDGCALAQKPQAFT